jgi:WD40 repeat protein
LTPDGKRAVIAYAPGTLKVRDLQTGKDVLTLNGHKPWVYKILLSPDGRRAISCSKDETLRVWDLETGEALLVVPNRDNVITQQALSPDGRRAVFGYYHNGALKAWDLGSGEEFPSLPRHNVKVTAVALSPDGRRIVSGYADGILKLWDLDKGEELHTLAGHTDLISSIILSPDGRRAFSASGPEFKIWDIEEAAVLASFTADDNLSACVSDFDLITIGVGDLSGRVDFLTVEGITPGAAIVTPAIIVKPSRWIFWHRTEKTALVICCPYCYCSSEINENDKGQEVPCHQCGRLLKINPFSIPGIDPSPDPEARRN